jgi:hypothetical protein
VLLPILGLVVKQFGLDILQAGMKLFEEPVNRPIDKSVLFACPRCGLEAERPEIRTGTRIIRCECKFAFPVKSGYWNCDCGNILCGPRISHDLALCSVCGLLWNINDENLDIRICRCRFIFSLADGKTVCCDKHIRDLEQIPTPSFLQPVPSRLDRENSQEAV